MIKMEILTVLILILIVVEMVEYVQEVRLAVVEDAVKIMKNAKRANVFVKKKIHAVQVMLKFAVPLTHHVVLIPKDKNLFACITQKLVVQMVIIVIVLKLVVVMIVV